MSAPAKKPSWRIFTRCEGKDKLMSRVYRSEEAAIRNCDKLNYEARRTGKGNPYSVVPSND